MMSNSLVPTVRAPFVDDAELAVPSLNSLYEVCSAENPTGWIAPEDRDNEMLTLSHLVRIILPCPRESVKTAILPPPMAA